MPFDMQNWDPRKEDFNDLNYSTVRGGPASSYVRQPNSNAIRNAFALYIKNIPGQMTKGDLISHLTLPDILVLDIIFLPPRENLKGRTAIVKVEDGNQGIQLMQHFDNKPPLHLHISKARTQGQASNTNVDDFSGGFQPVKPTPIQAPAELEPKYLRRPNKILGDLQSPDIITNNEQKKTISSSSDTTSEYGTNAFVEAVKQTTNATFHNKIYPIPTPAKPTANETLTVDSVKANLEERFNNNTAPKTNHIMDCTYEVRHMEDTYLENSGMKLEDLKTQFFASLGKYTEEFGPLSPEDISGGSRYLKSILGEKISSMLKLLQDGATIINEIRLPEPDNSINVEMPLTDETVRENSTENNNKKIKIMKCVFCRENNGSLRCPICFAYYCSQMCRKDDWHIHSKTCKPLPILIDESHTDVVTEEVKKPFDYSSNNTVINQQNGKDIDDCSTSNSTISQQSLGKVKEISPKPTGTNNFINIQPSNFPRISNVTPAQEYKKFHFKKLKRLPFELNRDYKVELTSCTKSLFVRIYNNEIKKEMMNFMNKLKSFFKQVSDGKATNLCPGELFCVYDIHDKNYYRAKILQINGNCILSQYVDYGDIMEVDISNARIFDESFLDMPVACLSLDNLTSFDGVSSVKNVFETWSFLIMSIHSDSPLTVDLKDEGGKILLTSRQIEVQKKVSYSPLVKDSTSQQIEVQTKVSSSPLVKEPRQVINEPAIQDQKKAMNGPTNQVILNPQPLPRVEEPIKKESTTVTALNDSNSCSEIYSKAYDETDSLNLPIKDGVEVLIMNNTSLPIINVVPEADIAMLEKLEVLSEEIQNHCENKMGGTYKPQPNELVVARFDKDEQWYRAAVIGVSEVNADVIFVDYGNVETVEFPNLLQMPKKFMELPLLAVMCSIVDLPEQMSEEEKEVAMDIVKERIVLDVKECQDFIYTVSIPSLRQTFKELMSKARSTTSK